MSRLIDADLLELDADYDDGEFWAYSKTQIDSMPTIEPERKVGKWKKLSNDTFHCRECGKTFIVIQGQDHMNFCPNCEADMRGGDEG